MKIIFITLIFFANSLFASYQKVSIGKIDDYYENILNKEQILKIILEIKNTFDSQLSYKTFDYSMSGKAINIVYVPASKLKLRILKNKSNLKELKNKISSQKELIKIEQKNLKILKKELKNKRSIVNNATNDLNSYIKEQNEKKITSKKEYDKIQRSIKYGKMIINKNLKTFNLAKAYFEEELFLHNNMISTYNNLILKHNYISEKIERLNKNFKEKKGVAIGYTQIKEKTYYKNGKRIKERTTKNYMKKIEIYGFDDLKQLKAILAHEIGHLVGIAHIKTKGALMNPILQKNQIKDLNLTKEDIISFDKVFL